MPGGPVSTTRPGTARSATARATTSPAPVTTRSAAAATSAATAISAAAAAAGPPGSLPRASTCVTHDPPPEVARTWDPAPAGYSYCGCGQSLTWCLPEVAAKWWRTDDVQ